MSALFELQLLCPQAQLEALADALEALDAMSISVEDADAQTKAEVARYDEPGLPAQDMGWQRSRVLALYPGQAQAQEALRVLQGKDFFSDCSVLGVIALADQDWVRLTQSQFHPVEVTPDFWIVPTWHEPPSQARCVIRLDPGLAFGTGTHPTTHMCLRWLAQSRSQESRLGPQTRVLDYGCGSGILAIAAAKFGAAEVDALDIDADAVRSAALNAQANEVQVRVGLPQAVDGQYGLVLANILATPLMLLAPLLWSHVAPAGWLVLSGILERQAQELKTAYSPYCELMQVDSSEGWILMAAQRPVSHTSLVHHR